MKLTVWQRIVTAQIVGGQPVESVRMMRMADGILNALEMSDADRLAVGWKTEPERVEYSPNGDPITVPEKSTWEHGDYEFDVKLSDVQMRFVATVVAANKWPSGSWSSAPVRKQILALYDKLGIDEGDGNE